MATSQVSLSFTRCAEALNQEFIEPGRSFVAHPHCIAVINSKEKTNERIYALASSKMQCIILGKNSDGDWIFTHPPFVLSATNVASDVTKSPTTESVAAVATKQLPSPNPSYFSKREILELVKLNPLELIIQSEEHKGTYGNYDDCREPTKPALINALKSCVARYQTPGVPVVMIGAGTSEVDVVPNVILTQPNPELYARLKKLSPQSDVIQVDIQRFIQHLTRQKLEGPQKRVPCICGLNVFDTISPEHLQKVISQISSIQGATDTIVSLHDTSPLMDGIFWELSRRYSNESFFLPYFNLIDNCTTQRLSIAIGARKDLTELEGHPINPSLLHCTPITFFDELEKEAQLLFATKRPSALQIALMRLRRKGKIQVVEAETLFIERMARAFNACGYSTQAYYENGFALVPENRDRPFIYKPVTDMQSAVAGWSLTKGIEPNVLIERKTQLPPLPDDFFAKYQQGTIALSGAEVLVIVGTKK